jgi:CCR4-NOT transcriptional regulation complex NOT5 subunit
MPTAINTHIDWETVYKKHSAALAQLEVMVESNENEMKIELSPGAIEMLFIPVIEMLENDEKVDFADVSTAFQTLVQTMANSPSPKDHSRRRTSFSAIKAFYEAWCNIPPFCSATKPVSEGKAGTA